MCQHADSRRAYMHLDSQRAETLRAHMQLDTQRAENPRAQKYWSFSEYFVTWIKNFQESANLKSENLLQVVLIFSRNSLLIIKYVCQLQFCIFFCMQATISALTLPVQLCIWILSVLTLPVQLCIWILSVLTLPVHFAFRFSARWRFPCNCAFGFSACWHFPCNCARDHQHGDRKKNSCTASISVVRVRNIKGRDRASAGSRTQCSVFTIYKNRPSYIPDAGWLPLLPHDYISCGTLIFFTHVM